MVNAAYMSNFASNGNTALSHEHSYPHLRLIEGGPHTGGKFSSRQRPLRSRSDRQDSAFSNSAALTTQSSEHLEEYPTFTLAGKLVAIFVLIALSLALVIAWVTADAYAADAYASSCSNLELTEHIVCQGDTLWDIAATHGVEGMSTQELVRFIQEYNNLDGAQIYAGDRLMVPQNN